MECVSLLTLFFAPACWCAHRSELRQMQSASKLAHAKCHTCATRGSNCFLSSLRNAPEQGGMWSRRWCVALVPRSTHPTAAFAMTRETVMASLRSHLRVKGTTGKDDPKRPGSHSGAHVLSAAVLWKRRLLHCVRKGADLPIPLKCSIYIVVDS